MKKARLIMLSLAIVAAAGAAMATTSLQVSCKKLPQYFKYGENYYPAGTQNEDYYCLQDLTQVCTYYYDAASGQYKPCIRGKFTWPR